MAIASSKQGLVNYCLRQLGAPVLQINVAPEQIEDRVEEALAMWRDYYPDSLERNFYIHYLTDEERARRWVKLPDEITSVVKVLGFDEWLFDPLFSDRFQFVNYSVFGGMNRLLAGGATIPIGSYVMAMQYLKQISQSLGVPQTHLRFNRLTDRLFIDTNLKNTKTVVIECYSIVRGTKETNLPSESGVCPCFQPEEYEKVWGDRMLAKTLMVLLNLQWSQNLSKFSGVQMPGGITLNGAEMLERAKADHEKLLEEYQQQWARPAMFFMG